MNWELIGDVVAGTFMIVGCLMSLGAAIGLVRFPDLLTRMHAATKPQVFGLLLLLIALVIESEDASTIPLMILAWAFMLFTVPVSAHMVGRAAYRSEHLKQENLTQDDLKSVVEKISSDEPR